MGEKITHRPFRYVQARKAALAPAFDGDFFPARGPPLREAMFVASAAIETPPLGPERLWGVKQNCVLFYRNERMETGAG